MNEYKKEVAKKNDTNALAERNGYRTYKECAQMLRLTIVPTDKRTLDSKGKFLIHAENGGTPHCIGVDVDDTGKCKIFDGCERWTSDTDTISHHWSSAVDASTVVVFETRYVI